jgi:hypothetical protein
MKKTTRRLALNKETLRKIPNGGLRGVAGGIIAKSTDPDNTGCPDKTNTCASYCACQTIGCPTLVSCNTGCCPTFTK